MRSVALVAASSFNRFAFFEEQRNAPYDHIIAVDGGYAHLAEIGVSPTLALGDFDSLGYTPQDVPLAVFPEQKDDSDLGLALDWCERTGFDSVTVYAAFAGRIDHTLAALQTMAGYAQRTRRLIQGIAETERIIVLPEKSQLSISRKGQSPDFCALPKEKRTVSVISLADCSHEVTIEGMKYELRQGDLTNLCSLGLSNELVGQQAKVLLGKGCLLVILPLSQDWAVSFR